VFLQAVTFASVGSVGAPKRTRDVVKNTGRPGTTSPEDVLMVGGRGSGAARSTTDRSSGGLPVFRAPALPRGGFGQRRVPVISRYSRG
jgi:hypothetical protein